MPSSSEPTHPILDEIRLALSQGRRREAIGLAVKAMGDLDLTLPWVVRLVAEGMEQDGLIMEGLAAYNRAQMEAPDDPSLKKDFAAALMRHGAHDEAVAPLDAVLARTPDDFEALLLRGRAHAVLRQVEKARADLDQAHRLRPASPDPLEELADLAAARGEPEAKPLGLQALKLSPTAARAAIAVARAHLAEGDPAAARALIDQTLAHARISDEDRAKLLTYLGDALDALYLPDEAQAAWLAREAALRPIRSRALAAGLGERHILLAQRLLAWFEVAARESWPPAGSLRGSDAEGPADHVFLVSFPRSGTTLLEQGLAAHPDILAADESGALGVASDHVLSDEGGLQRLERMTAAEADACRDAYWAQMGRTLGTSPAGRVVLDKDPLNAVRLPIIAKLFPQAKILYALRDPRDVVLSGYRRLFYSKMLEFHSVDSTARFYDAVQALTRAYRERLTLNLLEVRHETLVADQEAEMRRVLAFLGLDWRPEVLDLAAAAPVSFTPSAAQLARGLNAESVGAWKRHAALLSGVLPLLEPWAARLGYDPAPASALAARPKAPASPPQAPPSQGAPSQGYGNPSPIMTNAPAVAAALEAVQAALRAGQTARAMQLGAEALARGATHPLFHRLRGVQSEQAGRPADAIGDFEAALALEGEEPQLLNVLGLCLARTGRPREGLARLDRAIALKADVAAFHYNRGWTCEMLGDVVAARAAYETAAHLAPNDARTLGALAALAARRADWAEARLWSDRARKVDPDQPAAIL
ncbi:MAG: sulfotransferase, partial [Alphaproteobacteria bacterium]|nr:sulfotransferase [Alphaproteobacteria bacterium]